MLSGRMNDDDGSEVLFLGFTDENLAKIERRQPVLVKGALLEIPTNIIVTNGSEGPENCARFMEQEDCRVCILLLPSMVADLKSGARIATAVNPALGIKLWLFCRETHQQLMDEMRSNFSTSTRIVIDKSIPLADRPVSPN